MAEHFIGMERLLEILRLTKFMQDPIDVIAELESEDVHKEKRMEKGKAGGETEGSPAEDTTAEGTKETMRVAHYPFLF